MAARHLLTSNLGALVAASTAGLRQQTSGVYTHIDRLTEAVCSLAYVQLGRRQLHTPPAGISHMNSLRSGTLLNSVNVDLFKLFETILSISLIRNSLILNN